MFNKIQRTRDKNDIGDKIFNVINILFLGIFMVACIAPFYYIFINTISDNSLVTANQIRLIPKGIHFQNYVEVFKLKGLGKAAFTSVARTVLGSLATIISCSVVGYTMSKKEFWCRKFWYRFMIITMYFSAGMIPIYLNIRRLELLNNFWVYILPAFVSPYNMILVKTYMENLPQSLEEAAYVDGAGYFVRFTRIVLPLSKPILATVCIFSAVGQWNSFMDTVMYMSGGRYQTLQSTLYTYLNQAQKLADLIKNGAEFDSSIMENFSVLSVQYTVSAVTILPILCVYPFFQKYFTKGIMIGAVKG